VQSVLIKLYVAWGRRRGIEQPMAYARRALVNEVVSLRRRRWTTEVPCDRPAELARAGVQSGPEQRVLDTQAVWQALVLLTARQRAVVVLRYYEGLSEVEIATALDIAPGTVKGHAHAALVALGAHLDMEAPPPVPEEEA
jgi:RNA polymerase sigma factor (sigma-70 family)